MGGLHLGSALPIMLDAIQRNLIIAGHKTFLRFLRIYPQASSRWIQAQLRGLFVSRSIHVRIITRAQLC